MEAILEAVESALELLKLLEGFLGIDFALMLPVLVLVSLIANFAKIRTRFPDYKNSVLAVMAFTLGCGLTLATDMSVKPDIVKDGLKLGSMSAFTYQFVKPLFRGLVSLVSRKYKSATGEELQPPDQFV